MERYRTVLMFQWDYFNDLNLPEQTTILGWDELKGPWSELKGSIMADWVADKNNAGARPYAWWLERGLTGRLSRGQQRDFLEQHDLLSPEEKAVLEERDLQYKEVPGTGHNAEWLYENGYRPPRD